MIEEYKQLDKNQKPEPEQYWDVPYEIPWATIGMAIAAGTVAIGCCAYSLVCKDFYRKQIDNPKTISIHVERGQSLQNITEQLKESNLIKFDSIFSLYAQYVSGKAGQIQYGDFEFTNDMQYDDIINVLCTQSNQNQTVRVTVPEGFTAVAIAKLLESKGLCTVEEFLACANGDDGSDFSQYEFWGMIKGDESKLMRCEGYLFPDTYDFYAGDTVYNIVNKFYKQFDQKISNLMVDIDKSGYSLDEVVILAQFIQEEAGKKSEDSKVSAVFHNRLESSDPLWSEHKLEQNTSSYIKKQNENNYLWNSPTAEYLGWTSNGEIPTEILDKYDTYKISGLPVGAVSNPGIEAIKAAIYPYEPYIEDEYYFFVTGKPGTSVAGKYFYAKTLEEHQKNVKLAGW